MPRVKKRHVLSGIKVKEAMRRQVIKLSQSAPIDYCINRMIKYKINSVLLTDGKQHPVGIVSKTDIMSAFYAGFSTHLPVEDIMWLARRSIAIPTMNWSHLWMSCTTTVFTGSMFWARTPVRSLGF